MVLGASECQHEEDDRADGELRPRQRSRVPRSAGGGGFRLRATAGAGGAHARIHLAGAYVEVRVRPGAPDPNATAWFVRTPDSEGLRSRLGARGLSPSQPTPYSGFDGRWLDIELGASELGCVAPILSARTDLARWPPAEADDHANGAVTVTGLELGSPALGRLSELLAALAAAAPSSAAATRPARAPVRLGPVAITVVPTTAAGIGAVTFRRADGSELRLALGRI